MDDLEVFKTSVEELTADVVEMAREVESEPEDATELLQSYNKTWTDEELLLLDEQRKWFLKMESTSGEDTVKTADMATKEDLIVNIVERTDSNFERSTVD